MVGTQHVAREEKVQEASWLLTWSLTSVLSTDVQRSGSVSSARVIRPGAQAALTVHETELQMSAHLPAGDQSKEQEPRAGEMRVNVL